jgi:hypothetical protein
MWNCPKCNEQVEDDFEVCWNCQSGKDKTLQAPAENTDVEGDDTTETSDTTASVEAGTSSQRTSSIGCLASLVGLLAFILVGAASKSIVFTWFCYQEYKPACGSHANFSPSLFRVLCFINQQPGCPASAEWRPFASREGGFQVQMPGTPVVETQNTNTPFGNINQHWFRVEIRDSELRDRLYAVSYFDIPEHRTEEDAVTGAKNGALSAIKMMGGTTILAERPFSFREHKGFETDIRVERLGFVTIRAFVVQKRFYLLMAGYPQTTDDQVGRFLTSFELRDH